MNALYQGSIHRIATTGSAVMRNAATSPMSVHRARRRGQVLLTLLAGGLGDHHVRGRHVLVAGAIGGGYLGDLVDDIQTRGDLAEHGVAVVRRARVIEEVVVDQVHEELRRGA